MKSFFTNRHLSLSDLLSFSLLFHINCFLSGKNLDMGLWGKIGANSPMSSVGPSAAFGSSVHLYVINRKIFKIFGIGVWLKIINKP